MMNNPNAVSKVSEPHFPLITVAMPVYNPCIEHLRLAVLSIIKQTFFSWELVIIDDTPRCNALESISDICDSRIRIISDGKNKGLTSRLNEVIDMARGRYLARMDQDDISYPDRFFKQIETLQSQPDLDLVATRCITISYDNEPVGTCPYAVRHKDICSKPWRGFYLSHPTWMGKIEWFREYRYVKYFGEDQDLLTRSYKYSRFATVPEVLFAYRVREKKKLTSLLNARASVLCTQTNHYLRSGKISYFVLVILIYVMRVMMDFWNALSPVKWQIGQQRAKKISDDDLAKWKDIWKTLCIDSEQ